MTTLRYRGGAARRALLSEALKALTEGEERGLKDYNDALQDPTLPPECKSLIRTKLLPQTQAHIPVLDRLMSAQ